MSQFTLGLILGLFIVALFNGAVSLVVERTRIRWAKKMLALIDQSEANAKASVEMTPDMMRRAEVGARAQETRLN